MKLKKLLKTIAPDVVLVIQEGNGQVLTNETAAEVARGIGIPDLKGFKNRKVESVRTSSTFLNTLSVTLKEEKK